jgi:hypothetical protein
MKLDSFKGVMRAALMEETLATHFTTSIARIIYEKRGVDSNKRNDMDPDIIVTNVWPLFPPSVEFGVVESAFQVFVNESGIAPGTLHKEYAAFLHFLMLISPALVAPNQDVAAVVP